MNKKLQITGVLISVVFLLSSCEAIGGIFKAGVWSGIFLVAVILALVIFIISRINKK